MFSEILSLTDAELDRLMAGIAQGTIREGASLQQVRHVGLSQNVEAIHRWLPEAVGRFGSIEGVAAALHLLREQRRRTASVAARPEIILTGPDFGDTMTRDTRASVRELFESARRSILIVGYTFHESAPIFEPLAERMAGHPDLTVRLIVNVHPQRGRTVDQTLVSFARDFWRSSWPYHPRPEVYYAQESPGGQAAGLARIHAKMIVVDYLYVYIGSADFTMAAFHRNLEFGLKLESENLAYTLMFYFERLVESRLVIPLIDDEVTYRGP